MALISSLRNLAKKHRQAVALHERIRAWLIGTGCVISPALVARWRFRRTFGRGLDLRRPRTFDEKCIWLMLNWRNPLKSRCADKYSLRSYVRENGLGAILPELIAVFEDSDQIDFETLPQRFVLKCTHGWNCNIICTDKSLLDRVAARRQLSAWLRTDFSRISGEVHYRSIRPRIVCESYLDDGSGRPPIDYKVYCFNGEASCILACSDRRSSGHATYDFYDRQWRRLPYIKPIAASGREIGRPQALEEIIRAAETLSRPFPFVRMDFYDIHGRAVLGEMTFTPKGCIHADYTEVAQREMGDKIMLPAKYPGPRDG